jgi:hypothetical protein
MQNRIALVTVAALPMLWAASASATEIEVRYVGPENGYLTGRISGERNANVAAGQFDFDVIDDGGVYWDDELNAFCIDVSTNLVTGSTVVYDLVEADDSSYLNDQQRSLMGQLFDQRAASLGSAANDAAFQLALWEIVYDSDATLNLTSGIVADTFSANSFSGARAIAAGWLSGLDTSLDYESSSYQLFVLAPVQPQRNQTLLTWKLVSVPEPGTLSMLGAGLLLVGAFARRRAQRTS